MSDAFFQRAYQIFNPRNAMFKDPTDGEDSPIQADSSSKYLFDNEDAIVVNFKKNNDEN